MKSKSAFLHRQFLYGFAYDIDYSEQAAFSWHCALHGENIYCKPPSPYLTLLDIYRVF